MMPDSAVTQLRLALRAAGYSPLPCEGKRPAMKAWEQRIECSGEEIALWDTVYSLARNTGVLTRTMPALDIDILSQAAAEAVEELVRERFEERGYILVRIGQAPKRAIVFRTNEPFAKITANVVSPAGVSEKIELLCSGQQLIAYGLHPATRAPYRWHGGEPGQIAHEDLPYISAQEAQGLVEEAAALLVAEHGYTRADERPKGNGAASAGGGGADWSWLLANIAAGRELHDSADVLAAKLIAAGMSEGAAVNLIRGAFEASVAPHDERWRERYADIPRDVASAVRKFAPEPKSDGLPAPTLHIRVEAAMIAPRQWLHAQHYMRGAVTGTVAPGGYGKTTLILHEVLTMARKGLRVWYISGEDPLVELDRRIAAHCQHHGLACPAEGLFVDDRASFPMSFAANARGAVAFNEAWFEHLAAQITKHAIDVVTIDPFVAFHTTNESDNTALAQIIAKLSVIAQATNAGIDLSHHMRKAMPGAAGVLTVDDSRGASAITNGMRSVRVLNRMDEAAAALAKIDDERRSLYLRIDNGKRNMAPPEKAAWWRLVSVHLPNGDNVQAIEPYAFPDPFAAVSTVDVDWVQKFLREGGPRRADSQSPDWLGHHLGEHCGRDDTNEKAGAVWASRIISSWLKNGVFKKIKMRDPASRKLNISFYADNGFAPPDD